jgi:DNA mismatch repair protein MutS
MTQLSFDAQSAQTPLMRQYADIKKQAADAILFFRLGDFYEMFFEDAVTAAGILDIALTSRDKNAKNPIPLCGVPYHSAKSYIAKLLDAGKKVAICEQVGDPKAVKGKNIVERQIVRIITPGTRTDEDGLSAMATNTLASIYRHERQWFLAWLDIHAGSMQYAQVETLRQAQQILAMLTPAECIVADHQMAKDSELAQMVKHLSCHVETMAGWQYEDAPQAVLKRYGTTHAKSLGLDETAPAMYPMFALLDYVETQNGHTIAHLQTPTSFSSSPYLQMDAATQANLELLPTQGKAQRDTLFGVLAQTQTLPGTRLLKQWIAQPLQDMAEIERRLQCVQSLIEQTSTREKLTVLLKQVRDMERILPRVACKKPLVRDLLSIRQTLETIPAIAQALRDASVPSLVALAQKLPDLSSLHQILSDALTDDPPMQLHEGGVIRSSYDETLARLRKVSSQNQSWIVSLEQTLKKETNIGSLKVGYNKVFGYYVEVTKAHIDKVPDTFIRKQTLVNAERFITQELKAKEDEILEAKQQVGQVEAKLFQSVADQVSQHVEDILETSQQLAAIDVWLSLAQVAIQQSYVRPKLVQEGPIDIRDGRHPMVEVNVRDRPFVPNDLQMNDADQRFILLTGPNMAGKSTIMRQAALMMVMAQMGSFVPASHASLPVVDQIFTRIGAQDDVSQGRSTFMVEMNETAHILRCATPRSFVLLDEIGRGTSTYDGLSIAWAVTEALHDDIQAKTMFATHYHELSALTKDKPAMVNMKMTIREWQGDIVFMHKMQPGEVEKSYGIEVAKLAGVPSSVIQRAKTILAELENDRAPAAAPASSEKSKPEAHVAVSAVERALVDLDVDACSPKEALDWLYTWKTKVKPNTP